MTEENNNEPVKRRGKPKVHPEGIKEYERTSRYHQKYYHLTNKPMNCEICGKQSTVRTLTQHYRKIKLIMSEVWI